MGKDHRDRSRSCRRRNNARASNRDGMYCEAPLCLVDVVQASGASIAWLELPSDSTVQVLCNEVVQAIDGESSMLQLLHEGCILQNAMTFADVGFSSGEGQANLVTAVVLPYPFADHEWDFRNHGTEVKDIYSELVARNFGAIPSAEGITFNGLDQYVDIDAWEWGGAMSIEVYVKWNSFKLWSRIFCFANISTRANEVTLINRFETSTAKWEIFPHQRQFDNFWTIDEWVHIVVTVAGKEMQLFKNGTRIECLDVEDGAEPSRLTRDVHYLGRSCSRHTGGWFDGTIAYLRIWHDRALTQSHARALYESI